VFLVISLRFSAIDVGLEYDEAIFQHGAVHMLRGGVDPPFPRYVGGWFAAGQREFPLMVMPYAGAAKPYLLLIPYAIFGAEPVVSRAVSSLITAFGLLSIGLLVRRAGDALLSTAVTWLLAIPPRTAALVRV
jgi:hypothetical protein